MARHNKKAKAPASGSNQQLQSSSSSNEETLSKVRKDYLPKLKEVRRLVSEKADNLVVKTHVEQKMQSVFKENFNLPEFVVEESSVLPPHTPGTNKEKEVQA